jgi:hypothetical protein
VKNANQHRISVSQLIVILRAEDCLPVLKMAEESSRNIIQGDTVISFKAFMVNKFSKNFFGPAAASGA